MIDGLQVTIVIRQNFYILKEAGPILGERGDVSETPVWGKGCALPPASCLRGIVELIAGGEEPHESRMSEFG